MTPSSLLSDIALVCAIVAIITVGYLERVRK